MNEDAEYHEAGDEGAQKAIPTRPGHREPTPDQAAALASVRDVPGKVSANGRKAA